MHRILVALLLLWSWAAVAQEPTELAGANPAATEAVFSSPDESQQSAATPAAQPTPTFWVPEPEERWWLPKGNWIYGYGEFDFAPPHNEPDPNFCAANAGDYGGANSQCNLFARYLLGGQVWIRPFGKTALRRIKLWWNPTLSFGKNVPQYLYTYSWQGIGMENSWGADVYLGRRFDFRVTQHLLFTRFGDRPLGPAYLGPNGPWGRYFTIGVRKYFGNPKVFDDGAK